jgi:methionine synthase II (cobalamin-independent)
LSAGSLPRPLCKLKITLLHKFWSFAGAYCYVLGLQQAYADYDAGKISREELVKAQDKSVEESIKRMEMTGQELVTDGEQRASSFATYPITE